MATKMTARENLLAVLRHEKPNWIPCTLHIANMNNIPGQLPGYLLEEPIDRLAISRYVGGDILYEISAACKTSYTKDIKITRSVEKEYIIEKIETPIGNLENKIQISKVKTPTYKNMPSHLAYPPPLETRTHTEYSVKSIQDYKILRYLYDHVTYNFCNDKIIDAKAQVGDDGVVVLGGLSTPLYNLISAHSGLCETVYHLFDEPNEVEKTMELMAEKSYQWLEQACLTDADVIRSTDDLDTNIISPEMFERYCVPVLKKYAQICHEHNKLFILHMCGHIKDFLPGIKESNIDAVHCLCPPPTGNTPMHTAREVFGEDIAIMARIDALVLLNGTPEQVSASAISMLKEVAPADNFILIVPCGRASLENLHGLVETMIKYGEYPIVRG